MSNEVQVPRLLRVHDLAKQTGIEPWRWYELFARGEGPQHIRVGKTIRVSSVALGEWIAQQESKTNTNKEQ